MKSYAQRDYETWQDLRRRALETVEAELARNASFQDEENMAVTPEYILKRYEEALMALQNEVGFFKEMYIL